MPACRTFPFTGAVLISSMLVGCATSASSHSHPPAEYGRPDDDAPRSERRLFEPRAQESIFSPMDLPTPDRVRTASGSPGTDYWQQRTDYVIEATLDEPAQRITGKARITYTNNSPESLPFIWINLEQNLFEEESLATLSSLPDARFTKKDGFDGGFKIESVRDASGQPLKLNIYDTVARIDLPTAIPPATTLGVDLGGPSFTFDIAWSFQVPEYGIDRMGIQKNEQGDVFQIAQWFPAVCVFDDVHGWNTLPYLGQGEFYTNFGSYDVKLTVPRSHIVAATGALQNPEQVLTTTQRERLAKARTSDETVVIRSEDEVADPASRPSGTGPLTWHFKADRVRTFAWTTSSSFIWDAARINGAVGTLAQSVYPKEALPLWEQSTKMLKAAIEGYNTRWFEYPYPVATNVNGCVGGMEYPMIIFCGDRGDEHGLFGVTTHEIGHNWFPMVVNTDERRHAWMDEGFNSFINIYSDMEYFKQEKPGESGRSFAGNLRRENPPMDTPHDLLGPGLSGNLAYAKPANALYLLRESVLGPERFDAAFREYIRRWAFKSPRPADFYRTMENVSGANLAWFWRGWFTESTTLDQSVVAVEQRSDNVTATVTLANLGEMVMPVTLLVNFDDGSSKRCRLPAEIWQWTNEWKAEVDTNGKRVSKVIVDPDEVLPDSNGLNNVWSR